jgi:hypothetical protein
MSEHALIGLASLCLNKLKAQGIDLEVASDMEAFEKVANSFGKPAAHPMLATRHYDLLEQDSFGLICSKEGRPFACTAGKYIDLGSTPLSEHWKSSYKRLYGANRISPVDQFTYAAAKDISGSVVYAGELYIDKSDRGNHPAVSYILQYFLVLSALKWKPRWIYAFMSAKNAREGKATQYGFTRQYPGAQIWHVENNRRSTGEYLIAVTMDELVSSAQFYLASEIWHNFE